MYRQIIIPLACVVVVGCGPTPAQIQQAVRGSSTEELCDGLALYPRLQQSIMSELSSRGAKCDWQRVQFLSQQRAAREARSNADAAEAMQAIGAMGATTRATPAPPPKGQFYTCDSYAFGSGIRTSCK